MKNQKTVYDYNQINKVEKKLHFAGVLCNFDWARIILVF
jgi:hypothetical protein